MKIGAACALSEIGKCSNFTVLNIENPLYPGYLDSPWKTELDAAKGKIAGREIIVDGAYIDLNPGTPEPMVRDLVLRKVSESILFARAADAAEIIFLSNYLPMVALPFYDGGWVSNSLLFWKEIASEFSDMRISVCNTFEYSPDILLRLVDAVDRPNFGMAFDLGHALVYSKVPLTAWWKSIASLADSVYLHSNDGCADQHLSIAEGVFAQRSECAEIVREAADKRLLLKSFNRNGYGGQAALIEKIINCR